MSHHHHHDTPGPSLAAFLTPLVGQRIALHVANSGPVTGNLDGVVDDGARSAVVVNGIEVPCHQVERYKLHFNPDNPPKSRRARR